MMISYPIPTKQYKLLHQPLRLLLKIPTVKSSFIHSFIPDDPEQKQPVINLGLFFLARKNKMSGVENILNFLSLRYQR